MKIGLAQMPVELTAGDSAKSLANSFEWLVACGESLSAHLDLLILPEAFAMSFRPERVHDLAWEEVRRAIRCLCHGPQAFTRSVIGGAFGEWHGQAQNLAFLAYDDLEPSAIPYAKRRLFPFGTEASLLNAGDSRVMWSLTDQSGEEWAISPKICYDLRFPELFTDDHRDGIDLHAVIAQWPAVRQHHWESLLIARAIENQSFVVGVNVVGENEIGCYSGGSMVVNHQGEVIVHAGDEPSIALVEISKEDLDLWRSDFPAWRDR